jgi:hypothetical protein
MTSLRLLKHGHAIIPMFADHSTESAVVASR